jgi:hypothetical protein
MDAWESIPAAGSAVAGGAFVHTGHTPGASATRGRDHDSTELFDERSDREGGTTR